MAEIDLLVEDARWRAVDGLDETVRRAAEAACAGSEAPGLAVLLGDDATVCSLNREWRGKDSPTNVLSFPATGPMRTESLGDLALAYETCAREAAAEGKTLADHLTHLVVHGTLHLLGHDHETETDAEAMEALETRLLAGLGVADPYRSAEDAA